MAANVLQGKQDITGLINAFAHFFIKERIVKVSYFIYLGYGKGCLRINQRFTDSPPSPLVTLQTIAFCDKPIAKSS